LSSDSSIRAVIFDMDGVLVDSEQLWDEARREVVEQAGGRWREGATEAMQGMSSTEWSAYLHDELGVAESPDTISEQVVGRLVAHYQAHLPLLPGAVEAVRRMAERWPLGLASSANRPVIDAVLDMAEIRRYIGVTVSSEEVPRGKPAPDAADCAVVEDSANGIRSGVAAGMTVVAIPNPHYPPPADVLAAAAVVLDDLTQLTPAVLSASGRT
jgi:beta-phosphoglucomutase-like phosphatase (HAD superfamily)